ncbi:MAG: hypothetical protein WD080_12290 [Egibacteraceae bacterium]
MSDTPTPDTPADDARRAGPRSTAVDARPVGFWAAIGVTIAVVVLGFGAWWVWGVDRAMPMAGDMGGDMGNMPHTDVRLPPVEGLYEGEEIFFVHPEASDAEVAGVLTEMMGGSPVLVVPELAAVPDEARDDVFVFTNGIEGMGPFGFQADVFPSTPEDAGYSPLRTVVLVTWRDEDQARELRSADEVTAAADAGEIDLEETDAVVNMPLLTWPEGQR